MSAISQFYSKLRAVLGASYGMIILFMFLPFMVVSCGSGDSRTVLAEQTGTDFLMFNLPEGQATEKAQEEKTGIYVMGGLTWALLLTAVAGLVLVVRNAEMKKTGFVVGLVGSILALVYVILLMVADAKMKEDVALINIEVGSGLSIIFVLYVATTVFAKLQKKPQAYVPPNDIPLDGQNDAHADAHNDTHTDEMGRQPDDSDAAADDHPDAPTQ